MQDAGELARWRKAMRASLLDRRVAIEPGERRRLDGLVTALLLDNLALPPGAVVSIYWPFKGEFDPRVAALRLRERGARIALPVVTQKSAPLQFREWWPGVETQPGVFGLPVPVGTAVVVPDVALIPPVGFDAMGYRLGYGGGYFDRTLASLAPQPLKIGVARDISRIETIRPQPWDVPMDRIVTESGVFHVEAGGLRKS